MQVSEFRSEILSFWGYLADTELKIKSGNIDFNGFFYAWNQFVGLNVTKQRTTTRFSQVYVAYNT